MSSSTTEKKAVRSAESQRTSSCEFADRAATAAIGVYRSLRETILESNSSCNSCYSSNSNFGQNVLAAIMLQLPFHETTSSSVVYANQSISAEATRDENHFDTELLVVSWGLGTKVLAAELIESDRNETEKGIHEDGSAIPFPIDKRVRDCHAEVLARRGFMKFLYNLCIDYSSSNRSADEGLTSKSDAVNPKLCQRLLERSKDGRLQLKAHVKIHLYTSSQPCGNATVKKWAKSQQEKFDSSFSGDSYPSPVHRPLLVTARSEGQVALLVKRNRVNLGNQNDCLNSALKKLSKEQASATAPTDSVSKSSAVIPNGTATVPSKQGNVMTCSDKIALWNALGLQGTLLAALVQPVYLETVVVGRKFSKVFCERALCCRLQTFTFPSPNCKKSHSLAGKSDATGSRTSNSVSNIESTTVIDSLGEKCRPKSTGISTSTTIEQQNSTYQIHHPSMLGTSVKFDEGVIVTGLDDAQLDNKLVTNEGEKILSRKVGAKVNSTVGASFNEHRCICSWIDISRYDVDETPTDLQSFKRRNNVYSNDRNRIIYTWDVVDSTNGFLFTKNDHPAIPCISRISSYSLYNDFLKAQTQIILQRDSIIDRTLTAGSESLVGLIVEKNIRYKEFKKRSCPEHYAAKEYLLSASDLFEGWIEK